MLINLTVTLLLATRFIVPISCVICNDIMAYMFGFFFGRTPLIKVGLPPFLPLPSFSPPSSPSSSSTRPPSVICAARVADVFTLPSTAVAQKDLGGVHWWLLLHYCLWDSGKKSLIKSHSSSRRQTVWPSCQLKGSYYEL